jgi:Histidine kinase-, DNA gyrase B-, and HSP90-like ATPase
MTIDLKMGNSAIRAFKRLPYQPWYALAEYIDNSTQSYFDHVGELGTKCVNVSIVFDSSARTISIVDDAFGMSEDDLDRALTVGMPPPNPAGRSRYGMGMKTASCWFADEWSVSSKQLGCESEFEFSVKVDEFADGADNSTTLVVREKPESDHWTRISLRKVNRQMSPARIREIKVNLASIFRKDLESGTLVLKVDHDPLTFDEPTDDSFLPRSTGGFYFQAFDETVGGVHISGWIGCFAQGKGGQGEAGISVFQNGRCIMGASDAWRPVSLFGSKRGGVVNQKLVGELNVDDHQIQVSHTKDQILWQGEQQDEIEEYLFKLASNTDILKVAKQTFSKEDSDSVKRDTAVAAFKDWSTSSDLAGRIGIVPVPTPEVGETRSQFVIEGTKDKEPDIVVSIPGIDRKIFIKILKLSPNDPYYAYEITDDGDLITVINESHAGYLSAEQNENPLFVYFVHCALDSWAEWKCQLLRGEIEPASVREIKDNILKYEPKI